MSHETNDSFDAPLTIGQHAEIRRFQELGEIFPSDILGEDAIAQSNPSFGTKEKILIAGSIVVASVLLTKLIANYAQEHHRHFRGWNNEGN